MKKKQRRGVERADGWSVVITIGTGHFALSDSAHSVNGRAFFHRRRDAVAFKNELATVKIPSRVVRATVLMREVRR